MWSAQRMEPRGKALAAGVFVVLCAAAAVYVLPILRDRQATSRIEAVSARQWETYAIGDSGLSVSLPGPPRAQGIELPAEARKLTTSAAVYRYEVDGIHIAVSEAIYAADVRANLEGSVQGALDNISRQTGGTLQHSRAETQIDGRPGVLVDLRIRSQSETFDGKALFATGANRAWSAIVLYPPGQTAGEALASKVIGSFSFAAGRRDG